MLSEERFEIPTIEDIYNDIAEIASLINRRDIRIDVIVGISRGGLIPARLLSDFLLVPEIKIVSAGFYLGPKRRLEKPVIISPIKEELNGKIVLLVDDVADTGETLKEIENHLYDHGAGRVYTAVIYKKPWNRARVDFYIKETDAWIIFPWERVETISQLSKMEDWDKLKNILEKDGKLKIIFEKFLIE